MWGGGGVKIQSSADMFHMVWAGKGGGGGLDVAHRGMKIGGWGVGHNEG